ncbi:MAG: hypothetical protein E7040_08240 [Lentisphaerae bacterium]|nr:hypothetical protein [Lentisphaerota bacterium]
MKQIILALAAAFFLTGCCNIEYKGKELSPLQSSKAVVLYFSPNQYPKNSAQDVLGDAKISGGTNWTTQELQAKLKSFAAEKGANGVLIERIERVPAGEARPDQVKNLPSKTWVVGDNSSSASKHFREDMTNYSKKPEAQEEIYRIVIHAKLLNVTEKR